MLVNELLFFTSLRKRGSKTLISEFWEETSRTFNDIAGDPDVIPVIIAARNEEEDLPAILVTLARAKALPIVVDNGSKDETTYEIAKKMGAITLRTKGNKMGALQTGVKYVLDRWGEIDVLFTDADALVPRKWARGMVQELEKRDTGNGVVVFGNSFPWHGPSKITDLVRSIMGYREARRNIPQGKRPLVRGSNIALRLRESSDFLTIFFKRDPLLFPGVDMALYHDLVAGHVDIHSTAALDLTVLMRGDRVKSLRDFMLGRKLGNSHRLSSYRDEYGKNLTTTAEWKADKPLQNEIARSNTD
jgi:glycosyltransferase involved in cell wall biosynthesis